MSVSVLTALPGTARTSHVARAFLVKVDLTQFHCLALESSLHDLVPT